MRVSKMGACSRCSKERRLASIKDELCRACYTHEWRKSNPDAHARHKAKYLSNYYNKVDPYAARHRYNPYTNQDDEMITEGRDLSDEEIAIKLGRSIMAIQVRRYRLLIKAKAS